MATVRFVRNRAGMVELLLSAGMKAMLEARTEAVAAAANSDASWDRHVSGVPGTESISYRAKTEIHHDRWVGQVSGDHPAALNVEAKHRVLGRSVDAAGMKFKQDALLRARRANSVIANRGNAQRARIARNVQKARDEGIL